MENRSKIFEDVELQTMLDEDTKTTPRNWTLVNKLFPIGYERWERFRRPVDGYHDIWTNGKAQKHTRYFDR